MSARWAWRRLATGLLAVLLSPVLAAFLTLPGAQADNPPPIPTVSFSNMSSPLIGQSVTFDVSFVNTGTVTGYGPYVDLQLPRGHDLDDGLTFTSATYLGSTITPVLLTADAGGCVYHPYAVDKTGSPVHVCGLVAGQSYVVLRLPFGSFTPGQPAAVVHVTTALSNKANAGYALTIGADGGFQFGATAVNDPSTDPSTLGTGITTTVTPTVMRITKTYNGPEDETATGPNYRRSYTIDVTVAPGQTVQNLTVSDVLPNTIQYVAVVSTSPTPVSVTPPAAPGPGGTLSVNFGQVTGTGGTDAALTFSFYVPRVDSGSAAILDPATGAFDTSVDNAGASGSWTPIDTRDGGPTTVTAGPATHTLTDKSIAVQKSVSLVTDTTPPGVSPGDTLQWTISVQVSDYFALNNVIVDDLLGDGTRVDGSFTPTLAVTGAVDSSGARSPLTAVGMASGHAVVSAVNGSGQTPIRFRLSDELVTRGELDRLVGGCVNPVTGSSTPDCSAHNDGPTTATIVFRSIVQQTYISGAEVVEGDTLVNEAAATGTVLNTGSFASTGNTIGDGSANVATAGTSASISIDRGSLQKSIYAVNGVAVGSQTGIHVSPGSQLTYRLEQTFPTSRTDDFVMTDYLPLPVFYAAGVTTFDDASKATPGTIPAAGHANYGPSDTFHSLISDDGVDPPVDAPTPAVTSQVGANSVTFTYGDFALYHPAASVADILFTVTVSTDPFADGLLLTNQARSQTKNAVGTIETADAIVQITLDQPVVTVTKGVVGTDNTAGTFTPATKGPAGVAFTSPTGVSSVGCPGFTGGPITSAGLTANPIDSNLSHVDAGDYVRFAITLQNTGHANAFGVDVPRHAAGGLRRPVRKRAGPLRRERRRHGSCHDGPGRRPLRQRPGAGRRSDERLSGGRRKQRRSRQLRRHERRGHLVHAAAHRRGCAEQRNHEHGQPGRLHERRGHRSAPDHVADRHGDRHDRPAGRGQGHDRPEPEHGRQHQRRDRRDRDLPADAHDPRGDAPRRPGRRHAAGRYGVQEVRLHHKLESGPGRDHPGHRLQQRLQRGPQLAERPDRQRAAGHVRPGHDHELQHGQRHGRDDHDPVRDRDRERRQHQPRHAAPQQRRPVLDGRHDSRRHDAQPDGCGASHDRDQERRERGCPGERGHRGRLRHDHLHRDHLQRQQRERHHRLRRLPVRRGPDGHDVRRRSARFSVASDRRHGHGNLRHRGRQHAQRHLGFVPQELQRHFPVLRHDRRHGDPQRSLRQHRQRDLHEPSRES